MIDFSALQMLVIMLTGWLERRERDAIAYLIEENRVLRRQLGGRRLRFTDDDRRRLAVCAIRVGRRTLGEIATIVTPDTLLRWHRQLIVRKWTYEKSRQHRRGVLAEIQRLVVRMAGENPTWGYTRIQGALKNVGHRVGRSTIARILKSRGLPPVLRHHGVLICDRDRTWSRACHRLLGDKGIRVVLSPVRAPNANAYAERFVRSIKEECLDRMIPMGERHFRHAVTEFVEHYHRERNHQGLENQLIAGALATEAGGRVRRRQRLGGWLNYYERAA